MFCLVLYMFMYKMVGWIEIILNDKWIFIIKYCFGIKKYKLKYSCSVYMSILLVK